MTDAQGPTFGGISDDDLARLVRRDRATVDQWRDMGLPYGLLADGTRVHIPELATTWRLGKEALETLEVSPRRAGTLDTVAAGFALQMPSGDRSLGAVIQELRACLYTVSRPYLSARVRKWRKKIDKAIKREKANG